MGISEDLRWLCYPIGNKARVICSVPDTRQLVVRYSGVKRTMIVQSTAPQTIQNCQTFPVDFQPYSLYHKAQS
jgi:hypothetical protein